MVCPRNHPASLRGACRRSNVRPMLARMASVIRDAKMLGAPGAPQQASTHDMRREPGSRLIVSSLFECPALVIRC